MEEARAIRQIKVMKKGTKSIRLAAEAWDKPWKTLIATVLSAQTMDEVTIPNSKILFAKYNSIQSLSKAKSSEVLKIIKPINFNKTKSKNVVNCAKKLISDFKGKIPETIEELIILPGVGRKTANVFLSESGIPGIGVDTHVSQISQKLNWTKNSNPRKIEKDLKSLFSKRNWNFVNSNLVRFGKTYTSRKEKEEILKKISKIR
ncbi:MAG: endonuclease III [Candidatus Pacearchaeota archaeon]